MAVGGRDCRACLHFHSPHLSASGNDDIHFNLVLVAVVPESEVRVGPPGLRDELLQDERLTCREAVFGQAQGRPFVQPDDLFDITEQIAQALCGGVTRRCEPWAP